MRSGIAIGCFVCGYIPGLVAAGSPTPAQLAIVDEARAGNRSSVTAVHAVSAKMTIRVDPPGRPSSVFRADYLRSPEATRVYELNTTGGVVRDVVYRAGTQKAVLGERTKTATNKKLSGVITGEDEVVTDMDVWSRALFYLPHERLTLDEILGRDHTVLDASKGTGGGKKWLRVDFRSSKGFHYKVRLDPEVNYLIDRVDSIYTRIDPDKPTEVRSEFVVTSFKEVLPAVFFPETIVSKQFARGRLEVTHTIEITDIRLNQQPAAGSFDLVFPPGTYVTDKIRGTTYRAGGDQAPVGLEKKYSPVVSESVTGPTPLTAVETSSWSISRFLTLGSLVLVVVGITLIIRSRMKNRMT
jgi:hypothetical protein